MWEKEQLRSGNSGSCVSSGWVEVVASKQEEKGSLPFLLDAAYAGNKASRIKHYDTKVLCNLVMQVSGRKRCQLPLVQLRLTSRLLAEMLGAECLLES